MHDFEFTRYFYFYLFFKYLNNYKKGEENLNPGSPFKGY